MGGSPLCAIERWRGNHEEAQAIMGNSFVLLVASGVLLTAAGLFFERPMLYLFGVSDQTYPFADAYMTIYLLGSVFVSISLGMNYFINAQGFGRIGMMTVVLGAVSNIVLDPIFIFWLHMGVHGAALATVISQFFSAVWVLRFLTGKNAIYTLTLKSFRLRAGRVGQIFALGISGFVMQFTNCVIQVLCNSTLQHFGGDLYVGIMTVVNSVREFLTMPVRGMGNGAQPVIGFNYGAKQYGRVMKAINFNTLTCVAYTTLMWALLMLFPGAFISVFNHDPAVLKAGIPVIWVFNAVFFMMSLQFSGQTAFVALGKSSWLFLFHFPQGVIVVPLTILLPRSGASARWVCSCRADFRGYRRLSLLYHE
jgi:putative MATE family efflux protein